MAASIPLNSGSQTTTTSPSLGQSPFSRRTSGSKTMTTPSPVQNPSMPVESSLQITNTKRRPAKKSANPPNSGIQIAQTTSHTAPTPPTRTARRGLTREQKFDKHKRDEAVRRNMIGNDFRFLRDEWTPKEFKLPVNKSDCKKESLIAAADWLESMLSGNDDLEAILNAAEDTYGVMTEGYPTSHLQLQQQLGILPHTPPPSHSPPVPDQQPAASFPPPSFPEYGQGNSYLNQLPPQLADFDFQPLPLSQPNTYQQYYPPVPQDPRMLPEQDFMQMT